MPPGLPHRPPLGHEVLAFPPLRQGGGTGSSTASGRSSGRTMSIESLEHMVRSRVRMFLRHTWLVAILGTLLMVGVVWAGFYFTTEADHMRIAAGPLDAKFVQALSNQIANSHQDLTLQMVPTGGSKETAEAISKGQADLAILPSNLDDSLNWPVVAILRQNVMALIVPASPAATAAPAASTPAAKTRQKRQGCKGCQKRQRRQRRQEREERR